MNQESLEQILQPNAKIYFIGIGGIAMSAAACLAKLGGFVVEGSDNKEVYSPSKDVLEENEIEYFIGYKREQIEMARADLVIVSAGEDSGNEELKYVIEKNINRVGLAEFLYFLSREDLRVVVTGTHGKTTTAGLLGHIFKGLDDSSFMAGGVLQNYHSNFHLGNGHYFVFEGDEYKEQFDDPTPKFHYYKPDVLVLTNLEYDHPDVFENLESYMQEFRQLIANMPEDGLIVYNADDENLVKLVHESNVSSVSFAIENEADYKIENIQFAEYTSFEVVNKFSHNLSAQVLGLTEDYKIQLPGKLNVYNALACIATLRALGFKPEQIALEMLSYAGIKRRFEVLGSKNGVTVVDDYAHHPTAVRETLEAARLKYFGQGLQSEALGPAKLWAVFEPHTFSRTKATLAELAKAFDAADEVLISEIYPAREKASDSTISSAQVIEAVKSHSQRTQGNIRLVKSKDEALGIIKKEAKEGDVVLVMAVGSFNTLAYDLLK
ncbi:MAG: UDP-N-acetylmuramate--L-alanine ligase [Candidatus Doudnabacteria bacterium]|nr:UDP-N-acetylmuramate--L-alanine ligase [Candidatus Doudnabacteria bacterium]